MSCLHPLNLLSRGLLHRRFELFSEEPVAEPRSKDRCQVRREAQDLNLGQHLRASHLGIAITFILFLRTSRSYLSGPAHLPPPLPYPLTCIAFRAGDQAPGGEETPWRGSPRSLFSPVSELGLHGGLKQDKKSLERRLHCDP